MLATVTNIIGNYYLTHSCQYSHCMLSWSSKFNNNLIITNHSLSKVAALMMTFTVTRHSFHYTFFFSTVKHNSAFGLIQPTERQKKQVKQILFFQMSSLVKINPKRTHA